MSVFLHIGSAQNCQKTMKSGAGVGERNMFYFFHSFTYKIHLEGENRPAALAS